MLPSLVRHISHSSGPWCESACLGDDLLHALVQVQGPFDACPVALRDQSVDLKTVPLGIEEIARDCVSHLLVGVAYAVIDPHPLRLEPFVERLYVGRGLNVPGYVREDLGVALPSLDQSELVVVNLGSGVMNAMRPG